MTKSHTRCVALVAVTIVALLATATGAHAHAHFSSDSAPFVRHRRALQNAGGTPSPQPAPVHDDASDTWIVQIGEEYTVTQTSLDSVRSYQIVIPEVLEGRDVLIASRGEGLDSDPDTFISVDGTREKHPRSTLNADITCRSFGMDLCVVNATMVARAAQATAPAAPGVAARIYFGVMCYQFPCTFTFSVYYQQEYEMTIDRAVVVMFAEERKAQGEIIRLYVPTFEEYGREFSAVMLECDYVNAIVKDAPFKMTIYTGNRTNPDYLLGELGALDIWAGGKGYLLTPPSLVPGSYYTIELEAGSGAVLNFLAYSVEHEYPIQFFVYDARLLMGSSGEYYQAFYRFDFTNAYTNGSAIGASDEIALLLNPFQGNPDLYAHCSTPERPSQLTQYDWNSQRLAIEQITISPEDRAAKCGANTVLHIAIASPSISSLVFYVYPQNHALLQLFLEVPSRGDLLPGEYVTYKLVFESDAFTGGTGDDNVLTVRVRNENARAVFYVLSRQCDQGTPIAECTDSVDTFFGAAASAQAIAARPLPPRSSLTQVLAGTEYLTLTVDKSLCSVGTWQQGEVISTIAQCTFVFGVHNDKEAATLAGVTPADDAAQYTLTAKFEGHFVTLREGVPEHGYVLLHRCARYRFAVVDASRAVERVTFQLTTVSGSAALVVSNRKDAVVDEEQLEFRQDDPSLQFGLFGQYQVDNPPPGVPYYLYVCGYEATTYTLVATLKRAGGDDGSLPVSFVHLTHDIVQDVQVSSVSERYYFYFEVQRVENVTVQLIRLNGRFACYISAQPSPLPSAENHAWSNERSEWGGVRYGRRVRIADADDAFPRDTLTFFGVLVPIANEGQDPPPPGTPNAFSTRVSFHTASSQTTVHVGDHLQYVLQPNEEKEYRFPINANEQYRMHLFAAQRDRGSLHIYFSMRQFLAFPDEQRNDLAITFEEEVFDFERATFEGSSDDLWFQHSGRCTNDGSSSSSDNSTAQPCYLYFTVTASLAAQFDIEISLRDGTTGIELTEDAPLIVPFGKNATAPHHFYYFVPWDAPRVEVYLTSASPRAQLFANIIPYASDTSAYVYATGTADAQYSSINSDFYWSQDMIIVSRADLDAKGCSYASPCVIAVTVTCAEAPADAFLSEYDENETFTLKVATHDLYQLHDGVLLYGTVYLHEYKYYSLFVPRDGLTLVVSLSPIGDTDVDLFLSYGLESRPTMATADHRSRSARADYIILRDDEVKTGWYVVGVQGYRGGNNMTGNFVLQFSANEDMYFQIDANVPQTFDAHDRQTVYYQFQHYSTQSFSVVLSRTQGTANLCVKVTDTMERFTCGSGADWSTQVFGNKDVLHIDKNDPLFCSSCYYLIAVESTSYTLAASLIVSVQGEYTFLVQNSVVRNYLFTGEQHLYSYFAQQPFAIALQVYSGSIEFDVIEGFQSDNGEVDPSLYSVSDRLNALTSRRSKIVHISTSALARENNDNSTGDIPPFGLYGVPFSVIVRHDASSNSLSANYSIQVYTETQYREIAHGVPAEIDINERSTQTLKFFYERPPEDAGGDGDNVRFSFSVFARSNDPSVDFSTLQRDKIMRVSVFKYSDETYRCDTSAVIPYEAADDDTHILMGHIQTLENGQYCLVIENKQRVSFQAIVLVNPSLITTLFADYEQRFQITKKKQTQYYEIFVSQPGTVLVRATQCLGKIDIKLYNSSNDIVSGSSTGEQSMEFLSGRSDSIATYTNTDEESKVVYVKVKALQLAKSGFLDGDSAGGDGTQPLDLHMRSEFKLFTKFYEAGQKTVYDLFHLEKDGAVDVSFDAARGVIVAKVQALACTDDEASTCYDQVPPNDIVLYRIYVGTSREYIDYDAHCGQSDGFISDGPQIFYTFEQSKDYAWHKEQLVNGDQLVVFEVPLESIKNLISEEQQQADGGFRFHVKAVANAWVRDSNQMYSSFKFYYQTVQETAFTTLAQEGGKGIPIVWLIVSVVGIVILAVVLFFVFKKYKKVEKQLTYEMTDVRNVASLPAPEQFHQLDEEISSSEKPN